MTAGPDRLVVSPHPDDAVWSVGGCLARWRHEGCRVTVLTVFDGVPDDCAPAGAWRHIADPASRAEENRRALGILGVHGESVGLPDAALRGRDGTPAYPAPPSLFGPPHPDDGPLVPRIAAAIVARTGPRTALYAPLAAGDHVDHHLVRVAVEALGRPAAWFEDFPYRLAARHVAGLRPRYEPVELAAWIAAARCYASQAAALLQSPDRLIRALRSRAEAHGRAARLPVATRLWCAPPDSGTGLTQAPSHAGTAVPHQEEEIR